MLRLCLLNLTDPGRLATLVQQYFENFGSKACCSEDLKPYICQETEFKDVVSVLQSTSTSFVSHVNQTH